MGLAAAIYFGGSVVRAMRHRNTLDMFIKYQSDGFYSEITQTFDSEVEKSGGLVYTGIAGKIKTDIHSCLNFHEMIAAGIRKGALDEALCKIYFESAVIQDYKDAKKYIVGLRKNQKNKELMSEFEGLYKAWKENKNFQPWHRWLG